VKVLRHRPEEAQHHRNAIMKHPHSFRFVDELQQVFIISSGVTSWTQPLTSIIGNVSHLFFVLRSSLVDSGQFTFAPCMSWELLDSAGTSAGRQFNITTRYIIFQGIGWIRLI
jgi:hypothetical protein